MRSAADETLEPAGIGSEGRPRRSPEKRSWEKWTPLVAALIAGFYLVTSIRIAAHRLLWFDELVTVLISRLPGASGIVRALAHVDNNMPAPYFLLVHGFFKILGESAVVARLPSALAITAGLLITFDCARRLTDGLHGLIAISFLACSCLPYYGFEARSYGIYFMLAAFCFWVWIHGSRKYTSALLFGAAFFLSIMVHYYAVLGLLPYVVWEAREWRRWRMPSAKLIAGGVAACCAAAVLIPQMSGAKRYSAVFWSPPSPIKLRATFSDLLPDGLFLLVVILIWVALTARSARPAGDAAPMESAERIGWLGLLIPFAGYVLARQVTNAYVSRYFLGILPGVAVAVSCWSWRHFRDTPVVPAGIFLILICFGIDAQLVTVRHPEFIDPFNQQTQTRQGLQMENTLRAEGKHFTVLTNGLLYLELWYYAKHREEYILLVPSSQYRESHNTARYTTGLGQYYPMQFWNVDDLRKHAADTALVGPTDDVEKVLKDGGLEIHNRFSAPMEVNYLQ